MLGPGHILDLFCMLKIDTAWSANPAILGRFKSLGLQALGWVQLGFRVWAWVLSPAEVHEIVLPKEKICAKPGCAQKMLFKGLCA